MSSSANSEPAQLPGLGRPLDYQPMQKHPILKRDESILFPNALDEEFVAGEIAGESVGRPLVTLREVAMLGYIDHITDKENWQVKAFDEEIQAKWKAEMLEVKGGEDNDGEDKDKAEMKGSKAEDEDTEDKDEDKDDEDEDKDEDEDDDDDDDSNDDHSNSASKLSFSEAMADWVIEEVKHKAKAFEENGYITTYPGQVVKSDAAVPLELRDALKEAVKVLEDVSEKEKDWHPGSHGKVLDLVHPSLFPLVYGKSRVLRDGGLTVEDSIKRSGEGDLIPVPPEEEAGKAEYGNIYSKKFQWLPCDVALEDDGTVKIKSYVNNLHPVKHANLYKLVEQFIARAIPLWNAALTPILRANDELNYQRIVYESCDFEGEDDGDEDEDDDEDKPPRKVVQPEPGQFKPEPEPAEVVNLFKDYKGKGLQVIVKLANIELTPEKPTYEGGSWHVEGQLNEHICASAIYYYDSHNITESRLAFRHQGLIDSVEDVSHDQSDKQWLEQVFGCEDEGHSVQYLGATTTPEGRLLAWPNILQHRVSLFDKKKWERKIFKEKIQAKWKAEMLAVNDEDYVGGEDVKIRVSEAMANWVIAEVKSKAEAYKKDGYLSVYPGQVVKSDTAIPAALREALKEAIKVLEDVPEKEKDWHPGSDGKVLDLVHPSLFPLIYGKSRGLRDGTVGLEDCIERCGNGDVVPVPPVEEAGEVVKKGVNMVYSRKFQWLPCDVALEDNGVVRIKSYVNNLHPQKHADLYNLVEQVIARAIPLWNAALTPLLPANSEVREYRRIIYTFARYEDDSEDDDEDDEINDGDGDEEGDNRDEDKGDEDEDGEDDDDDDNDDNELESPRTAIQPDPEKFESLPEPEEFVDLFEDYKEQGLQVIVKLANIELTPENPAYEGGSWHVEGQLNEHICASAIYYYDSHNITESRLAFRQQGHVESVEEVDHGQEDKEWLDQVFGCTNGLDSVQELGSTATPEGRLLAWPNVLQHRVCPFELEDRSKRGWRKIIALFLVDPHIKIISTANVPVQRMDWWAECIKDWGKGGLSRLPLELQDAVMKEVDFPMSLEEAKDLRVELMEERTVWQKNAELGFEMHTFSLCEH